MLNDNILNLRKSIQRFFNDVNYRILWIQLVLFSILLGTVPYLWPVACLIFLSLSWVLNKPKGMLFMIYVLSFGWAGMAMCIAYFVSGWGWGITWGISILISSLVLHFRDLKQPLYVEHNLIAERKYNWYLRGQNLN